MSGSLVRAAAGLLAAVVAGASAVLPAGALASPANDDFSDAATLAGTSGSWTGNNDGATCESYDEYDEPDHDDLWCESSIWFRWKAPSNGLLVMDTAGTAWDTVLAVYTGNYLASLTWVVSNDDIDTAAGNMASRVGPFPVTKDKTYKIAVDGPDSGAVRLNWVLRPLPEVAIGDASVVEGNSGNRNLVLPVTLSEPGGYAVRVHYATANGTANTGDYTAKSGDVTIPAGSTSTTAVIGVKGDAVSEANETFKVNISGTTNAKIVDSQGIGTIRNDEPSSGTRLTVGDAALREGDSGRRNVYLVVTLSRTSSKDVTFKYTTSPGTARSSDFTGKSGSVRIRAGGTTASLVFSVNGDTSNESGEAFSVALSSIAGATGARTVGTITVRDDE